LLIAEGKPRRHQDGAAEELSRLLDDASDVPAACETVVDHLVDSGYPMPSIYLFRGGRLRCYAVRGYSKVYDGMPTSAGVIGQCFRTGKPVDLPRVRDSDEYLAAVAGVRSEVCVPIQIGDRVQGALNVESLTDLPADSPSRLSGIADLLADRVHELGGVPSEPGYQRLAMHAQHFAGATEERELQQLVLAAATDLSGLDSAALVTPVGRRLIVGAAGGSLQSGLQRIDQRGLRMFASWVASGTSCYSVDGTSGQLAAGSEQARRAGAQTVIVVPLLASREDLGVLMVAHPTAVVPASTTVELLEVLGALTATSLRTVRAVDQLRRQAAQDPLTGLGHAGTFRTTLADVISRPAEKQTAVIVMDIDRFKAVNDAHGHQAGDELLQRLARELAGALRAQDTLYRIGGDEFAAIITAADEIEAEKVTQRLLETARSVQSGSLSLGLAMAMAGESPMALEKRADEALYLAKRAGRNTYRVALEPEF
jgi:diguanylate cyclase (GGDEF)-like protein